MHTAHRFPIIVALLLGVVALSTVPLVAALIRGEAKEAVERALQDVRASKQSEQGLRATHRALSSDLAEAEMLLQELAREKRRVRLRLSLVRNAVGSLAREHSIDASDPDTVASMVSRESDHFLSFIRYVRSRSVRIDHTVMSGIAPVVRRFLIASLGEWTDANLQVRALERARISLLTTLLDAEELAHALQDLTAEHERLLTAYDEALGTVHTAAVEIYMTEEQISEIQQTVAEVEFEIRRLQGELSRIDARLRERAERELLEKGLMDPETLRKLQESSGTPRFLWPVFGPISAGYLDAGYARFFGVPHRGIDIVVPHGTPIFAAADGIVFLARDGGARGYSYLLIGHRDGFSSLYGHLAGFVVSEGQEVRSGQLAGYSGATPGTPGAGPMTTGAHFHFEIMKDGAHVNPVTVLP